MHRYERRTSVFELTYRRTDCGRYVEELQVAEHPLVTGQHPVQQLKVFATHHQLETNLVKRDGVAKFFSQRTGPPTVGNVHCEYQPVFIGYCLVLHYGPPYDRSAFYQPVRASCAEIA